MPEYTILDSNNLRPPNNLYMCTQFVVVLMHNRIEWLWGVRTITIKCSSFSPWNGDLLFGSLINIMKSLGRLHDVGNVNVNCIIKLHYMRKNKLEKKLHCVIANKKHRARYFFCFIYCILQRCDSLKRPNTKVTFAYTIRLFFLIINEYTPKYRSGCQLRKFC